MTAIDQSYAWRKHDIIIITNNLVKMFVESFFWKVLKKINQALMDKIQSSYYIGVNNIKTRTLYKGLTDFLMTGSIR